MRDKELDIRANNIDAKQEASDKTYADVAGYFIKYTREITLLVKINKTNKGVLSLGLW